MMHPLKGKSPTRFSEPAPAGCHSQNPREEVALQSAHLVWSADAENPQAGRQNRDNALYHC